jgi:hypothetical protein
MRRTIEQATDAVPVFFGHNCMHQVEFALRSFNFKLRTLRISGRNTVNQTKYKGYPVFHFRYLWMNAKMPNNLANEILKKSYCLILHDLG